ncbi:MAG: IBR domain-containing protein [Bacilli bacterium]|nr:IBR domain-containing protein [Bacilli bacterium]
MKFVEKKCPNCGAGLKFDDGATSVVCEYCNQTFYIQRDEKKYARVDSEHLADAYRFVDEVGKPIAEAIFRTHKVMAIVPIIVFLIAAVGIGISIFSFSKEMEKPSIIEQHENSWEEKIEQQYQEARKKLVTKLSQIDQTSLETFYDNAVLELDNYDGNNSKYKISSDWKAYGAYLLVGKETNNNYLYVVCKHTYKHRKNGKEITLYGAVKFDSLKLTDAGIVNNDFDGWTEAPSVDLDGDKFEWAYGYDSEAKLYNSLIRGQSGTYTIEATEGIYVES